MKTKRIDTTGDSKEAVFARRLIGYLTAHAEHPERCTKDAVAQQLIEDREDAGTFSKIVSILRLVDPPILDAPGRTSPKQAHKTQPLRVLRPLPDLVEYEYASREESRRAKSCPVEQVRQALAQELSPDALYQITALVRSANAAAYDPR